MSEWRLFLEILKVSPDLVCNNCGEFTGEFRPECLQKSVVHLNSVLLNVDTFRTAKWPFAPLAKESDSCCLLELWPVSGRLQVFYPAITAEEKYFKPLKNQTLTEDERSQWHIEGPRCLFFLCSPAKPCPFGASCFFHRETTTKKDWTGNVRMMGIYGSSYDPIGTFLSELMTGCWNALPFCRVIWKHD